MHLIIGATGLVGGTIANQLRGRGEDVRAMLRGGTGHPKSASLTRSGISVVAGDLGDWPAMEAACRGSDTVVCTVSAMPAAGGDALQRVDRDGVLALIDAAERMGVRRFVYTSFSGNIETDSPLRSAKRACEARLARSGMESVVLRPSYFMQVWLEPQLGFDAAAARARVFGDGTAPISYVSAMDVAAFGAAAATAPGKLRDVVQIGGPEAVPQLGVVALFERLSGRRFAVEHVPLAALQAQHQTADPLQKSFAALMIGCGLGDAIPEARDNARRYGVTLTSLEEYAASIPH
jgi:uncharacterized protein YbjT (DUF2867 family)